MATTTTNLSLRKPDLTDQVNVETDLNDNYDIIDGAVGDLQDEMTTKADTSDLDDKADKYPAPVYLTDAATIAVDASLANHFRVTLGGNRTLGNPTNLTDGQKLLFEIIQDGTGSRTLAYGTKYVFGVDVPSPTLSTTFNKVDFMIFVYNGAVDKLYCLGVVKGY